MINPIIFTRTRAGHVGLKTRGESLATDDEHGRLDENCFDSPDLRPRLEVTGGPLRYARGRDAPVGQLASHARALCHLHIMGRQKPAGIVHACLII
jgi:hypothetical protein